MLTICAESYAKLCMCIISLNYIVIIVLYITYTITYVILLINIYIAYIPHLGGFPSGSVVKNPPAMQKTQETWVLSLGLEDPLEEGMATNSSTLAWRIPWIEQAGRLQSLELDTTDATEHTDIYLFYLWHNFDVIFSLCFSLWPIIVSRPRLMTLEYEC